MSPTNAEYDAAYTLLKTQLAEFCIGFMDGQDKKNTRQMFQESLPQIAEVFKTNFKEITQLKHELNHLISQQQQRSHRSDILKLTQEELEKTLEQLKKTLAPHEKNALILNQIIPVIEHIQSYQQHIETLENIDR